MPLTQHVADDEKMRELILLIAQASEGDAPFGATKLNKLLFYVDFIAYRQFGKSITGHEYQRLPNGPAPRLMVPLTKSMESRRECVFADRRYFGKPLRRPIALREPSLNAFSAAEVSLAHTLVKQCWGKTAREMSAYSHRFAGWRLAKAQEMIPYEVALVRRGPRNKSAEVHAASLAEQARECLQRVQDAG